MERLLAASQERHGSVFSAMANPTVQMTFAPKTRESISAFLDLIERARAAVLDGASLSLSVWAGHFLAEVGYIDELRRSEKDAEAAENRVSNLKDLIATLDGAEPRNAPAIERLQSFLEDLTLDGERAEERERTGDAVTLITMHSCKGLEFPHVYVVGLEDGLLPHSRSKVEGTMDEERRLFYVAVTRAMQTLTLTHCTGRRRYGQLLPCHPSPFLRELPPHLVEHADERSNEPVSTESGKSLFAGLRAQLG